MTIILFVNVTRKLINRIHNNILSYQLIFVITLSHNNNNNKLNCAYNYHYCPDRVCISFFVQRNSTTSVLKHTVIVATCILHHLYLINVVIQDA